MKSMHTFSRALFGLLAGWSLTLTADEAPAVPPSTHPGAGQTVYFVLTDRFANGRTENDTGGLGDNAAVSGFDPARISHYHGGDFAGLTARLDYLKNLGISAVWVTPPFKNKAMQAGTAGYHGYWITDFLTIDPHLGTNEEFFAFVRAAHAKGLKVYMDIIVNHTADVIQLSGDFSYRTKAAAPWKDAAGRSFDEHPVADNGLGDPNKFPALAADRSFPYVPVVPQAEKKLKRPAWLNDPTLYHNRGNSTFAGESAIHGDFVGLDDLFTEHPRVVRGFIEIFSHWLKSGVDGYRIDTARHVNNEFWQAFAPAIRARARELDRPDFIQFGEVYNEAGDPAYLSEFSTHVPLDTTLDFGFFAAVRRFVSQQGKAGVLGDFFAKDDYYTDHDSNVHATTTFLGNHDAGRFGYFLQKDNPGASADQLLALTKLGHGLLLLSRGQPVLYYGDEQGMIGRGGGDMQAREDLFAAKAPDFKTAPLLGTARTGADDKFDETHPLYRLIATLARLRASHAALRTGSMLPRATTDAAVFAFSRFDRHERVEYVAAFNHSRTQTLTTTVPTSQRGGAVFHRLFASDPAIAVEIGADTEGRISASLPPLQFALWRADRPLTARGAAAISLLNPAPGTALSLTSREIDGLVFPSRVEILADVSGGDGFGEVTFTLNRASRPDQAEYLGTDDAPPYRIFWRPPNDLPVGEKFSLSATYRDLRGQSMITRVADLSVASSAIPTGIVGSHTPRITRQPSLRVAGRGDPVTLSIAAEGTAPLEYQWLRDDEEIAGATQASLKIPSSGQSTGTYRCLVRNCAGTVVSSGVTVDPR